MAISPFLTGRINSSRLLSARSETSASNNLDDLLEDRFEAPSGSGCAKESKEREKNDKRDGSLRFNSQHAEGNYSDEVNFWNDADILARGDKELM